MAWPCLASHDMTTTKLSNLLKAWRRAAGFTQEAAAALLGRSHRTLERWEQSRSTPKGQSLTALLRQLETLGAPPHPEIGRRIKERVAAQMRKGVK
jgi:transcriptional regulator with XRE-family HTH domain